MSAQGVLDGSRDQARRACLERAARDAAIVSARAGGDTLGEIADRFGLSRERVRQVLAAAGTVDRQASRRARAERECAAAAERRGEVLVAWRAGEQPEAIAQRLRLSRGSVTAVLKDDVTPVDRAARRWARATGATHRELRAHTDEDLIAAVRRIVEEAGRVPSGEEYNRIARRVGLPSISTIENRLGGWNAALRAAGFAPANPGRGSYTVRWTQEACIEAARRAASELGRVPSLRAYEELSQGREDLPSAATVRKRLGSWSMLAVRLVDGDASVQRAR